MTGKYDDIIELPHHVSRSHPHMPVSDRAAQFSPFAALTGYDDAVAETARLTDSKHELDEYEKEMINEKLQIVLDNISENPSISITYFIPDKKKSGGSYITASGSVQKIDNYKHFILMQDNRVIPIDDILSITLL